MLQRRLFFALSVPMPATPEPGEEGSSFVHDDYNLLHWYAGDDPLQGGDAGSCFEKVNGDYGRWAGRSEERLSWGFAK